MTNDSRLQANREQIEIFVGAMFKHAEPGTYVSLRSFYENSTDVFEIKCVLVDDRERVVEAAYRAAQRAAAATDKIVFCPPIATFSNTKHARKTDVADGLTLSVECDQRPQAARTRLEELLGPVTLAVASGGEWTDPETGELEPKLHLHWRLKKPARGNDRALLEQARKLAIEITGSDPSHAPISHPIRWPGSIHRKGEPKLCRIVDQNDCEIDLQTALAALQATRPAASEKSYSANGNEQTETPNWRELIRAVRTGEKYHEPLAQLATKFIVGGINDGLAVNVLRGLMDEADGPRDARWQARYDDIPRAVSTAREKFGKTKHDEKGIRLIAFDDIKLSQESRYLVKGLIPRTGLVLVWGPPKEGKSFWAFDLTMHVALGWEYRGRRVQQAPVVYCAFEGQRGIEARVEAFRQRFLKDHHDKVPFFLQPVTLDLIKTHSKLISVIQAKLGGSAPGVVVLDTLNRSLTGSESNDEDMAAYVRAADAIREAFECTVLIVHHCGIVGTRPRGHTSLTGAADAQLKVARDAARNIIVTIEFMKDGAEGDTIASTLEIVTVGKDQDGEDITSCIVVPVTEAEVKQAAKSWTHKLQAVRKAVINALNQHGHQHQIGGTGPKVCAVSVQTAREAHKETYVFNGDGDRADAERSAWRRNFKAAMNADLIRSEVFDGDELIWLTEPFVVFSFLSKK